MNPKAIFQQRQEQFQRAEQAAQRRYNQLALARLVWFLGSVAIIWLLWRFDQQLGAVALLLIGIAGFLWLLRRHQTVRRERDLNRHLAFVNADEIGRLSRQYVRPETGEQYVLPTHEYAGDLDVFGKQSLFRLLNRTHTHAGEHRLAGWLLVSGDAKVIQQRQQAAAQLSGQLDWRQEFEALAFLEETVNQSPDALIGWATADVTPLPRYWNVLRFVLPAVAFGVFVAWLTGYVPGVAVLLTLGANGFALSRTAKRAADVSEQTATVSGALAAFRSLFEHAERVSGVDAPGDAQLLQTIRRQLTTDGRPASRAIGQLARLTEGLNYRRNPYFYLLFGVATLWDVHYLLRLERWRAQHGPNLARWFDALGDLEVLNSLASFAYAHPQYAMPQLTAQRTLTLTSAAHPLLPPGRSVANALTLNGAGQTVLITGSNMSGKSTFLRTIGTNVVLALAGAVVSAETMTLSPVQVFTSMRTQDSLEESTSSFYAELKRLQTLIQLTQTELLASNGLPVLYFLDEILKGTNSADRHRGAEALIRQLHRTTASGFVSTHYLELGQLADASAFVRNYHFQSDLRDGELVFDYKLRDGICQSFNASQLMRAIGIDLSQVNVPAR